MYNILDALLYLVLSFSHWLSLFAGALLMLRIRSIKRHRTWGEARFYVFVMITGMAVWVWSGLYPTPSIFEDRAGLHWGIKTDNVKWNIVAQQHNKDKKIAAQGDKCLAVEFNKNKGWIIFHHFPTAPPPDRYVALEFYIQKNNLQHDTPLICLYGDEKIQYPSKDGISISEKNSCQDKAQPEGWNCIRVPISEFKLLGKGIIGIGIGKDNGIDEGSFYIDNVQLIEKK